MTTLIFSTTDYPTYTALKRAHPAIFSAFKIGITWFATTHDKYVIGYRPNQNRAGIRTKKNRTLGKRPGKPGRQKKHHKN